MPRDEVDIFVNSTIPKWFEDPITRIKAKTERELTAVLSIRHQLRLIEWHLVSMRNVCSNSITDDSVIKSNDLILSEYQLFSAQSDEINRWGLMAPDIIFTDPSFDKVVIVEAKIDSHFTFSDNPPNGQISRYLEFLSNCKARNKALIVVCPRFNADWYGERVKRAAEYLKFNLICANLPQALNVAIFQVFSRSLPSPNKGEGTSPPD